MSKKNKVSFMGNYENRDFILNATMNSMVGDILIEYSMCNKRDIDNRVSVLNILNKYIKTLKNLRNEFNKHTNTTLGGFQIALVYELLDTLGKFTTVMHHENYSLIDDDMEVFKLKIFEIRDTYTTLYRQLLKGDIDV